MSSVSMAKGCAGGLDEEMLSFSSHLKSSVEELATFTVHVYHCITLSLNSWQALSDLTIAVQFLLNFLSCGSSGEFSTRLCPLNQMNPGGRLSTHPQQSKICWGLATLMCDCLAVELQSMNFDYTSQSVHPFYGSYRCGISVECQGLLLAFFQKRCFVVIARLLGGIWKLPCQFISRALRNIKDIKRKVQAWAMWHDVTMHILRRITCSRDRSPFWRALPTSRSESSAETSAFHDRQSVKCMTH